MENNRLFKLVRDPFLFFPLLLLLLEVVFLRSYLIPSGSMIPTLIDGDRVFGIQQYFKFDGFVSPGDIVTFDSEGKLLIKRVVATGDDQVLIIDDKLYVNGELSDFQGEGTGAVEGVWELEGDELFVMGDNRANSADSRYIGPVNISQVQGKVFMLFLPLSRVTLLSGWYPLVVFLSFAAIIAVASVARRMLLSRLA